MTHEPIAGAPTPRDHDYLTRWLRRHGRGDDASPVLAARVTARRRAERIELVGVMFVAALAAGWVLWNRSGAEPGTAAVLGFMAGVYLVLHTAGLVALAYLRRADQRIAAALPARTAHAHAIELPAMLGGWLVAGTAVVFGGGLLTAGAALWLATDAADRAMAMVFLVALLIFACFGAAVLLDTTRRPAVAADAQALADDRVLRREDAHRAVTPVLALLALVAGVSSRSGDPLLVVYLLYAWVAGVAWVVAFTAVRHAPRRPATPQVEPQ